MHDVRLQLANQILLFLYSLKGIIVLALERGEVVWGAEKEEVNRGKEEGGGEGGREKEEEEKEREEGGREGGRREGGRKEGGKRRGGEEGGYR